jgi:hypothetical protein
MHPRLGGRIAHVTSGGPAPGDSPGVKFATRIVGVREGDGKLATIYWSIDELADAVAAGLERRARAEDLEQVVYGFDALDELGLHPLIQEGLRAAGYGVWPEQRYPGDRQRRKRSEGRRCDVVLTPGGRPLRDPLAEATLFAPGEDDPGGPVFEEAAYWLEVKAVAQFEPAGPFRRYSAELLQPVSKDLVKLATDEGIRHAGLLLVLMTVDRATAEHDLRAWHERAMHKGLPVHPPAVRGVRLTDRIGNGWCGVAVFGVRG